MLLGADGCFVGAGVVTQTAGSAAGPLTISGSAEAAEHINASEAAARTPLTKILIIEFLPMVALARSRAEISRGDTRGVDDHPICIRSAKSLTR